MPDLGIVHDDDDLVVVDKPAGVAAHPSLGWDGPTVVGALAAAGFRISTSGAPERAGRRASPRRRHERPHGRREVGARVHRAEAPVPRPRGREDLPHGRAGASRSARGHHRRARRAASALRVEVRRGRRRQARRHPLRDASRRSRTPRSSRCTSRPAGRTRSACTWRRSGIRAPATPCTARTRRCPRGSASRGSGCTPSELSLTHPGTGEWTTFESEYPADLAARPRAAARRLTHRRRPPDATRARTRHDVGRSP